jgi:hypothetical protein
MITPEMMLPAAFGNIWLWLLLGEKLRWCRDVSIMGWEDR